MKIAVMGTGMVGRALAGRLAELGHEVTVGTRDAEATLARESEQDSSYAAWSAARPGIALASFADAAAGADLVVNATSGSVSIDALRAAGEHNLAGKVLIDVSNPLDFSGGGPAMFTDSTDSVGERIQQAFPATRVVKSLNTMNASVMVDPSLVEGDHVVFVAGDDAGAKDQARALLGEFGWPPERVLDIGDITGARGTEQYLMLWLRLMNATGTATFNIAVNRSASASNTQ